MTRDNPHAAQDTLRLSQSAKQQILSQLERHQGPSNNERRTMRVAFDVPRVIVCITHRQGGQAHYLVTPRNLAARGLAFIHGQYVHTDTTCLVVLPRLDERWVQLPGRVLRCRHIKGFVHEVSVAFEEPIDLPQFVRLNREQFERWQQEYAITNPKSSTPQAQEPACRMVGTALVVMSFEAERALVAHLLEQQGLTVIQAAGTVDAKTLAKNQPVSLAIVDVSLTQPGGCEALRDLQDAGYTGSIIGMTADDMDSDLAQATAQKLGCNALLTKPLDVPRLYQTTEQLLLFTGGAGALTSSLAQNEQMRPLVEKFVQQAHKMAPTLQQALTSKDLSQLREMCRQIKGSGPSFGFQTVAMAAQSALNTLDEANNDLVAMSRAVRELVQMLQRTSVE